MRQLAVALLAVGIASTAQAQTIFKCVVKGKPVTYQTSPCPAQAQANVRQFLPYREPTAAELYARRMKEQRDSEYLARVAGRSATAATSGAAIGPATSSACETAKRERDNYERSAGLNRSYDGLRAWNDHVARACR